MLGFATIRKDGFPKEWLDRERWRSLIGEFPELRRIEFLNVGTERYRVPDSAELVEDGTAIGAFIWEKGQIYVDGPYSMLPLAKGIADILDAGVFDDEGNLALHFRNDSLIGFRWSHQARPASSSRTPWYRRLLGGKSA